jgi:hypothetical protein
MKTCPSLVVLAALAWSVPALAQQAASTPAAAATPAPASTVVVSEKTAGDTTVVLVEQTLKEPKFGRELGGHYFLPSHLIEDPFSYTAFGMTFGLGSGNALAPQLQLNPPDIVGTKWVGYTGIGVGFLQNVRILEYLSARIGVATNAYLGTGNGAVLTVGTSARVTGDIGVKGSLPVGKNLRFSATLDASYGPVYSLLIAEGLVDAIKACEADPTTCKINLGSFLQQEDTVTWTAGLAGAWAPWPFLGIIGNLQFIAPTKTGKASVSQNGLTAAGSVDFDAKPLLAWLPLGLNATYSITSPIGGNGVSTVQDWGFGLYYTGRHDMALGLEIDWKFNRLESNQAGESTLAWINFRYYWN